MCDGCRLPGRSLCFCRSMCSRENRDGIREKSEGALGKSKSILSIHRRKTPREFKM